jgi:hypothetical protein
MSLEQAYEDGCLRARWDLMKLSAAEEGPTGAQRAMGTFAGGASGASLGGLATIPLALRGHFGAAALSPLIGGLAGAGVGGGLTPESTSAGAAYGGLAGAAAGGAGGLMLGDSVLTGGKRIMELAHDSDVGQGLAEATGAAASKGLKPWHGRVGSGLTGAALGGLGGAALGGLAGLPGWLHSND